MKVQQNVVGSLEVLRYFFTNFYLFIFHMELEKRICKKTVAVMLK